jgi:pimeloyl-ACP methyl ester carboxylesterase
MGQVDPQLLKKEKEEHDAAPVETAFTDFTSCNNYKSGKTVVSDFEIPILAVYGAQDRMISPDSREKLTTANPSVKTVTIDGAGHYVILEAPKAFCEATLRFQHFCYDNIGGK